MATVIIAIDESQFAENAFKCYVDNLHKPDYKVVLLHVMEHLMHVKDMSPGRIIELQREAMQKAANLRDKYTKMVASLGIQAEVRIEKSEKPSHAIVDIATEDKAKFIVTGCRGMGLVRRTILGSVSDFILHHAHCPVFIYKQE